MPTIQLNPVKNKGFSTLTMDSNHLTELIVYASAATVNQYDEFFESLLMQCRETNATVNFTSDESGFTMRITGGETTLKKVFDILFEPKRYPETNNAALYEEKKKLFPHETSQKSKMEIIDNSNSKRVPPKGKILTKDDNSSKKLVQITKTPKLFHSSMSFIGEGHKSGRTDLQIIKHNRSKDLESDQRHEATMVEAFYADLARLTNPIEVVPKSSSLHDPEKDFKGTMVMVKHIEEFHSLDEIYNMTKKVLSREELIKKGIASILVDAFLSMENDCRGGNIGEDGTGALKRLDFGQSGWPLTAPYTLLHNLFFSEDYSVDRLGIRIKPHDSFPLTERDIVNFPNIQDAKPINWPARTKFEINNSMHENMSGLDGIEHDPEFIKQKYFYFLKRVLLSPDIIKEIGKTRISDDSSTLRQKHVDLQLRRMEELRKLLPNIPQFKEYFDKFQNDYLNQLIDEAKKYNAQFKAKSNQKEDMVTVDGENYKAKYKDRLIDISALMVNFNKMVTECAPNITNEHT